MPEYKPTKARHHYHFTQTEVKNALIDYMKKIGVNVPNGSATACDGYVQDVTKNCGFGREANVVLFIQEH